MVEGRLTCDVLLPVQVMETTQSVQSEKVFFLKGHNEQ